MTGKKLYLSQNKILSENSREKISKTFPVRLFIVIRLQKTEKRIMRSRVPPFKRIKA